MPGVCARGRSEPESYQCSISRNETDCGGGSPGNPAAISWRVNQRTSSSSSSARGTDSAAATRRKADHQRRRERPRLRRVIGRFEHRHAGFFQHFAGHGVLQALTRFDEARDRRISPGWPRGLAAEQCPLAIRRQHDDGRIEAWKMIDAAGVVRAFHDVPGAGNASWRTARATVTVTAAPVEHGARIREHAGLLFRQQPAGHAEILEPDRARREQRLHRFRAGHFGREIDAIVEAAQQHGFGGERGQPAEIHGCRKRRRPTVRAALHEDARTRARARCGPWRRAGHRPRTPRPCAGAQCDPGTVQRRRWVVQARPLPAGEGIASLARPLPTAPRYVRAGRPRLQAGQLYGRISSVSCSHRDSQSGQFDSTNSSLWQQTCHRCHACSNEM